jgi:hypothetical protein
MQVSQSHLPSSPRFSTPIPVCNIGTTAADFVLPPALPPTSSKLSASASPKAKKPLANPFDVLVDDREIISGGAWLFKNIVGDSKENYRPLEISTKVARMKTGDYSIVGMEDLIVVERKALSDCYSTLSSRRDDFEAEHARMADIRRHCIDVTGGAIQSPCHVVIEADWATIIRKQNIRSNLAPMAVLGVASHWSMRYGVQWWAMPGRRAAELWAFWLLRNFWRQWRHLVKEKIEDI